MNDEEMQGHTPGPWEIRKDGAYPPRYLITSKGIPFASLDGWAYDGVTTDEEDAANRNLIAAAPELLEACKTADKLIRVARNYFPKSMQNSDRFDLENSCAAISKAIVKAEGTL